MRPETDKKCEALNEGNRLKCGMNPVPISTRRNRWRSLVEEIRHLEHMLVEETRAKQKEFCYKIRGTRVEFTAEARARHRRERIRLGRYLLNCRWFVFFTAPAIWMCLIPLLLLDVFGSLYQAICFPIYGIPKVKRSDYLIFDRHHLEYLNAIEKLNCEYCAYANGILAYLTEIAARTEQHWCPIKHAGRVRGAHGRYENFMEFGDADQYRANVETIRRTFGDLTKADAAEKKSAAEE